MIPKKTGRTGFFARVHQVTRLIPYGQVATYGQIAAIVGDRQAARTVGWALRALQEDSDVPWHRVINAKGRTSARCRGQVAAIQRTLLEQEGIVFDKEGRTNLDAYQWEGMDWPEIQALQREWHAKSPESV
jgi:methylated-DNA-protein-cysteine methyltransferase related protein